jgi:aryl-alcohol dehydrogenase-like predicted oxidoreductase
MLFAFEAETVSAAIARGELQGPFPAPGQADSIGTNEALDRWRAEELATKKGVSANAVALAWVLNQSFQSLALVGPRSPGEIASSLPGAALKLTADEVAWLNLE